MDRLEKQIKGVTAGSDIPVYRICVGTGPKQVRLKDLRQTIIKKRTYLPSTHKNALMRKLRPRTRFMMSKDQLTTLNERLHTLQRKNGMGIPKGMDRCARRRSTAVPCAAADRRAPSIHERSPPDRGLVHIAQRAREPSKQAAQH